MSDYYRYTEKGAPFGWRPNDSGVKKDIKAGKTVMGKFGRTSAPEGYYMSGTTTRTNKAGDTTYAIYKKLPTQQKVKEKEKQKTPKDNNKNKNKSNKNKQVIPTPTNNYQSEIDTLLATISSNQAAQADAARAAQEASDRRLAELTSSFQSQMDSMAAAQQKQIEGIMAANQQAMDRMIAEQQERARQMQIAQQTEAANAARASQTADFQIGTDRGIGGIGQFKRRLDIKPVTSSALAIAGTDAKGANKMLNV